MFDSWTGVATAAIVAACIAALVSLIVAAFTWRTANHTMYLNAVTAERSKWIGKLRENIAKLLGVCGAIHLALPDASSPEARALREKADRLMALIQMQLNPNNQVDANIIALLPRLVKASQNVQGDYRALEKAVIMHAQCLLKEEWEKVKLESISLPPSSSKNIFLFERKLRELRYLDFCKTAESKVERADG
jgi:hypothetical protein